MTDKFTRIAIVDPNRCKPKECQQECRKKCPVVKNGKICIEIKKQALISEILCIGCGLCAKFCPFKAVQIINLPTSLDSQTIHRYGNNGFKLHRLPTPRPGQVLGLVGTNGIGKSTALKILALNIQANLGKKDTTMEEVVAHFRGSELQNYFIKVLTQNSKILFKPQYVDLLPRKYKTTVSENLTKRANKDNYEEILKTLDLANVLDRKIPELSGGELQRFAIAMLCIQQASVYIFDEPSSYLDIKQRLKAAEAIRSLIDPNVFIICVEHDLALLDYLSDYVCLLYGLPGAYGVVTLPYGVREGINIFLDGFIPTENMRFRETALKFKVVDNFEQSKRGFILNYESLTKTYGNFSLDIKAGDFNSSEIIVLLGENGTGKSTFMKMLAGLISPDRGNVDKLNISYKPQQIAPTFQGTVKELLYKKLGDHWLSSQFNTDVLKPLQLSELFDQKVLNLSGGELQRVALVLVLGKPADVYLIDEPSAYLDSEQRMIVSKLIKRFIMHTKKTAFIIEHDFIMATYLADRVIVFSGEPAVSCEASAPQGLLVGMNSFLKELNITFRRDPTNFRPRINKLDSVNDREQKEEGNYFVLDAQD